MKKIREDVIAAVNAVSDEAFILALQPELLGWDKAIVFVIPRADLNNELRGLIVAWIEKLRLHESQRFLPKLDRFFAIISGTEEEIDGLIENPASAENREVINIILRLKEMMVETSDE